MDLAVGLIGAKGAGKTSAFEAIETIADVQEITLASKLKDVSAETTGVPRLHFDSHEFKEAEFDEPVFLTAEIVTEMFNLYGLTPDYDQFIRPHVGKTLFSPRQIAQYVGTEVLRNFEADIHCRVAAESVSSPVGIITDMRFPNEFTYFQENAKNFVAIYIRNVAAEIEAGKDTHVSEAYLQDLAKQATYTVENDRDLKTFQNRVKVLFEQSILGGLNVS